MADTDKTYNNKTHIREHALMMLSQSYEAAIKNIDKALNSGAIDIDAWDKDNNPMLIPKAIVIAVLTEEVEQHSAEGTSFAKQVKKDAKNIGYYL